MYRFGWPFAKFLSRRFGVSLKFKVDVVFDMEEKVYIATSSDIPGLVVEAEHFHDLQQEVRHAIPELIDINSFSQRTKTEYSQLEDCCAA